MRPDPPAGDAEAARDLWRFETMLLLYILVIGLAAGWVADVVVNQRTRPESWGSVLLYGLVGSFIGGLLVSLLAGDGLNLRPSGLIGSTVGALVATFTVSLLGRRSHA